LCRFFPVAFFATFSDLQAQKMQLDFFSVANFANGGTGFVFRLVLC